MADATLPNDMETRKDSFTVYLITNKVNGKQYVGVTTVGIVRRWILYERDSRKKNQVGLSAAIAKYGKNNFLMEEIVCAFSYESMCQIEIDLIKDRGTRVPSGYNIHQGGVGKTREHRRAISEAVKARPVSEETRKKLSGAMKGRRHTPESIAKMSAARMGIPKSPEAVLKSANSKRGKPHSAEAKKRISDSGKGRKHSPESIERMRVAVKARWNRAKEDPTKMAEYEEAWATGWKNRKANEGAGSA